MSKKIAVMAGTKVDTEQGIQLVRKQFANQLVACPISETPVEQTYFQTMDADERVAIIDQMIAQLIVEEQVAVFLIYCNSLSASVDFEALAVKHQVPILTPFLYYKELARTYSRIGVISANAQGAAGIERVIVQENKRTRVYGITNLDWVDSIEKGRSPQEICERQGIRESIDFFEKNQVDGILFGCTHFPYFLGAYQQLTALECWNADEYLLATLRKLIA
ncbi:hypothetical protein BAU15_09115 [Enterococcus sp. JM4C]|uniref:aspartate/glutamate racemase family protein n=1 Tax=Candidatus Enterococcus huntleyi TaxID=1857217 RepID=UPI00137AEFF5|nr:aspartate/glutamate racemase family protein [Enterococcus sp. JM4C]KAF1296795.1 hypothetical protein BAU15_09115 [Enterococcus sp. JM4C]